MNETKGYFAECNVSFIGHSNVEYLKKIVKRDLAYSLAQKLVELDFIKFEELDKTALGCRIRATLKFTPH